MLHFHRKIDDTERGFLILEKEGFINQQTGLCGLDMFFGLLYLHCETVEVKAEIGGTNSHIGPYKPHTQLNHSISKLPRGRE